MPAIRISQGAVVILLFGFVGIQFVSLPSATGQSYMTSLCGGVSSDQQQHSIVNTTTEQQQGGGEQKNTISKQEQSLRERNITSENRKGPLGEYENMFTSIIKGYLREGLISPEGSFLDCGCQFGEQAHAYAFMRPNQKVYAVDPSVTNLQKVRNRTPPGVDNIIAMQAALSNEMTTMKGGENAGITSVNVGAEFPVVTVDSMFYDKQEPLAFAHWDVEGAELKVLEGGRKTILKDRPIFTTEVRIHQDHEYTVNLLEKIESFGYDPYMVDEVCGIQMDTRNVINIPRELSKMLQHSDTFNMAIQSRIMIRVASTTILQYGWPCCVVGGECCPKEVASDVLDCCSEKRLDKFLKETNAHALHFTYNHGFRGQRWSNKVIWRQTGSRYIKPEDVPRIE